MKPTENPRYIAIQENLKKDKENKKECSCKIPFPKKGICGKCKKKLR